MKYRLQNTVMDSKSYIELSLHVSLLIVLKLVSVKLDSLYRLHVLKFVLKSYES
jgi:hypothetical protein